MRDRDWAEFMHTLGHDPRQAPAPAPHAATHVVFGSGSTTSPYMFIGEAPGVHEDRHVEPFKDPSDELLTKMIVAMGLKREEVYITNLIKCRPADNRDPKPDEIETCHSPLDAQIEHVRPRWIVALGTFAAQYLLNSELGIARLRGRLYDSARFQSREGGAVKIVPTFHPAYLLQNPDMKKAVWDDLQMVMRDAGLKS